MGGGFDGRAVLVTGGALGIGRGIAEAFMAADASVAIADIDGTAAAEAATEIDADGQEPRRVIATIGDVSVAADAERMVAETVAAFGRLDVLVNNAGIAPLEWYGRVEDISGRDRLGVSRNRLPRGLVATTPSQRCNWPACSGRITGTGGCRDRPRATAWW